MKTKQLIFLLLMFSACYTNSSKNKVTHSQTVKRDYKLIIDNVIKLYSTGTIVSVNDLQNAVPITQDEFSVYYSYTFPEKGKSIIETFYKVDTDIGKHAAENHGDFLKLYLELASFADGEYAESYFEDVDFVIAKNKNVFCKIYPSLSKQSKMRLEEYTGQYCK